MTKSHTLLFAVIFIGVMIFLILSQKKDITGQNLNFYNVPILIAILIWVGLKILELMKRKTKI
ncbi:MAG TPA: hypothetical protein VI933_01970 [archaeon]|nr:hypothetical protein [archaeon]